MNAQERAGLPGSDGDDSSGDAGQAENRRVSDVNSFQRQRAEERLRKKSAAFDPEARSDQIPEIVDSMLHELSVHQIELEMQNEELRESQMALSAAKERYFDLYDMAPVGYFTISKHGLIHQANLTASGLFGVVRSALLNQPISQRVLPDDQNLYYRHRKQLMESGEAQTFELRMKRDDSAPFWAHLTMTAALDAENESEFRAVLIDISERKQAEALRAVLQQDLQEKNSELERTRVIAEKANQAKSDFLSSMSHELRTPLHAILGFGQLLESGTPLPTKEQKQSIDQILKAGWHLLALINEVLDLTVIEAGKSVLEMESISLPELIGECETMVEPMAKMRGISIAFPRRELPYFVVTDRLRFKQVLINLLSNSIKYNRPGGKVTVDCKVQSASRIRISVEDTGAGLSGEQMPQLFQPFNRLGRNKEAEEGTGIGLVVCKRLIELMSGNIGVMSEVGQGSTFWIELNLAEPPNPAEDTAQNTVLADLPPSDFVLPRLYTLLYVEDNLANLNLVEAIIVRRPHIRLLSAPTGARGVEMARELNPHAILMDIDLPGMSGIDALEVLTQDPITALIPVFALSANAMPSDIEEGLQAGFSRYLTKPLKISEFMQMLDENFPVFA